ncbi:GNAT family N-acetyltransferase [Candidatus Saccharibacteria bacterium]|nr:GNAT family N-acetyltransferase [Candidatus Saccharibacteria bacterium]
MTNIRLVPLTLENLEFTEFILKMRLDDTNYDFYQADADLESVKKWISKNIANKDDYFIILNDEKMVGYCALYDYNFEKKFAMLSIGLYGEDARGKGIGTAATKQLVKYGFGNRGLKSIRLLVSEGNPVAIKSYEKAGFLSFGTQPANRPYNGQMFDLRRMAIMNPNPLA